MTSPSPSEEPFGPCMRIFEDQAEDEVCNAPGVIEVLVRNPFALFAVTLCIDCKREHHSFYNSNRRPRRQRDRVPHTRGRART